MRKCVMSILSLGVLLVGACTTSQESAEPEAPPPAVEPAEQSAEATDAPEPTTAPEPAEAQSEPTTEAAMPFELTSTAFAQGEPIPVKFSCDGDDISPSLSWGNPPDGTQSLALIIDDPDAPVGTWDHWVVFNIILIIMIID